MFVVWFVASAMAWEHSEFVPPSPFVLELTTVDANGLPPGAAQEAIRRAIATWTDDACLETLDVSVVDTPDNVVDNSDGRYVVAVNQEIAFGEVVTYSLSSGDVAFTRFGEDYLLADDIDIAFTDIPWDLADDVADGTCAGAALDLQATQAVGIALGMDYGSGTAADSVYFQPACSLPVLSEDDRAGLQALYGSGIDVACDDPGLVYFAFGPLTSYTEDCTAETYGTSALVSLEWIADGTAYADPADIVFEDVGRYTIEVCGTFDVAPACDRPTSCTTLDREFLVCEIPTPVIDATVTADGQLLLSDLTALSDPTCGITRLWTISDALGVLDLSREAEVVVDLWDPGTYEVKLEVGINDQLFATTETVEWVSDEEPPADTDVPPEEEEGDEEEEKGGCGCGTTGAPTAMLGIVLVAGLGLRRRRVRS